MEDTCSYAGLVYDELTSVAGDSEPVRTKASDSNKIPSVKSEMLPKDSTLTVVSTRRNSLSDDLNMGIESQLIEYFEDGRVKATPSSKNTPDKDDKKPIADTRNSTTLHTKRIESYPVSSEDKLRGHTLDSMDHSSTNFESSRTARIEVSGKCSLEINASRGTTTLATNPSSREPQLTTRRSRRKRPSPDSFQMDSVVVPASPNEFVTDSDSEFDSEYLPKPVRTLQKDIRGATNGPHIIPYDDSYEEDQARPLQGLEGDRKYLVHGNSEKSKHDRAVTLRKQNFLNPLAIRPRAKREIGNLISARSSFDDPFSGWDDIGSQVNRLVAGGRAETRDIQARGEANIATHAFGTIIRNIRNLGM